MSGDHCFKPITNTEQLAHFRFLLVGLSILIRKLKLMTTHSKQVELFHILCQSYFLILSAFKHWLQLVLRCAIWGEQKGFVKSKVLPTVIIIRDRISRHQEWFLMVWNSFQYRLTSLKVIASNFVILLKRKIVTIFLILLLSNCIKHANNLKFSLINFSFSSLVLFIVYSVSRKFLKVISNYS